MSFFRRSAFIALVSSALLPLSAHAANRSFPGSMGHATNSWDEGCLGRQNGWLSHMGSSNCPVYIRVILPMSADNAAWYSLSVYGNRFSSPYTTTCQPMRISYTGSIGSGYSSSFVYTDGRAESLKLSPQQPVYSAGDALAIECTLGWKNAIYSYGWN